MGCAWTNARRRRSFRMPCPEQFHGLTSALRTPVFALGAALRVDWITSALRAPVFALGAALRAHGIAPGMPSAWTFARSICRGHRRSLRPNSLSWPGRLDEPCCYGPNRVAGE